jgi:peptidoglycan/LPS O-acetylase OafA/YrhL
MSILIFTVLLVAVGLAKKVYLKVSLLILCLIFSYIFTAAGNYVAWRALHSSDHPDPEFNFSTYLAGAKAMSQSKDHTIHGLIAFIGILIVFLIINLFRQAREQSKTTERNESGA